MPPAAEPERREQREGRSTGGVLAKLPWISGAAAIYLAFAVFLTWPVVSHLGSVLYGQTDPAQPGDLAGGVALLRAMVAGGHNPFIAGTLPQFNVPSGYEIPWGLNLATLPSTGVLWLLA